MIDKFGWSVRVGWARHEIVWLEAAMTLFGRDRTDAFRDISSMSGRSYDAVRLMAGRLKEQRKRAAVAAARTVRTPVPARVASLPPSQIRPPSMAQLMGRR